MKTQLLAGVSGHAFGLHYAPPGEGGSGGGDGKPTGPEVEVVTSTNAGLTLDEGGDVVTSGDVEEVGDEDLDAALEKELSGEEEPGEETSTEEETPQEPIDLPEALKDLPEEFKADDPTNVEAFDKVFLAEGGSINQALVGQTFSARYAAAVAAAKEGETVSEIGHMPPAFYEWAKDRYQVDDAFLADFERGQVALRKGDESAFFERTGGRDNYLAAISWASGKGPDGKPVAGKVAGYTKAQQDRFNALAKKGGPEFDDAVEALLAKAARAGAAKLPGMPEARPAGDERGGPRSRRPSASRRDVTAGAASGSPAAGGASEGRAGGGDTFKDNTERDTAFAEARRGQREARTPAEKRAAAEKFNAVQDKARRTLAAQRRR